MLLSRGLGKILWRELVRDTFQDRTCLSHSQDFSFRTSHSIASVRPALPYASESCLSWRNCYPKKQIYFESPLHLLGTAGSSSFLSLSFSGFISLDLRQAGTKEAFMRGYKSGGLYGQEKGLKCLERCLRGLEHLLFLQTTQVQIPFTYIDWLTTTCNYRSRGSEALCWPPGIPTLVCTNPRTDAQVYTLLKMK